MSKKDEYRHTLRDLDDWIPFLRKESGSPGSAREPGAGLRRCRGGQQKAIRAIVCLLRLRRIHRKSFLSFVASWGWANVAASESGTCSIDYVPFASDPRWRIREAVATGLQLTGDQNMDLLLKEMKKWSRGNWYEKRAAAATLAEPRLLDQPKHAKQVLRLLDKITASMENG